MKTSDYYFNLHHLVSLLNGIQDIFYRMKDGKKKWSGGISFGDLHNDIEIVADRELGKIFHERSLKHVGDGIGRVTIEGLGDFKIGDGNLWLTIDPLDGSLNYFSTKRSLGLPVSTCFTVLQKKENAKFSDVIMSLVMDLRTGDIWVSAKDEHTLMNDHLTETSSDKVLDIGQQILFAEMYYPSNREKITKAFADQKGWIRNPGSAAYEMAMVSSGEAVAFICDQQKQHELGAAYLLVKSAGGVVVDWDGNDLGDYDYLFNVQTPVILAANQFIADEILERLRNPRAFLLT